jgi:hypothetical protein
VLEFLIHPAAAANEAAEQWNIAMLAAWARSLLIDLADILSTRTAASSANQWAIWFAVASVSDSSLASPVVAFAIQQSHSSLSPPPRSSAPTMLLACRCIFDELAAHARAILGDPSIGYRFCISVYLSH